MSIMEVMLQSGANCEDYIVRVMVGVMMKVYNGSKSERCRDIHIYHYSQHSLLDISYENVSH